MSRVVIEGENLEMILSKLREAMKSVDELIDTIEMLSDEDFQRALRESMGEAERGDVEEFGGLNELRKEISRG